MAHCRPCSLRKAPPLVSRGQTEAAEQGAKHAYTGGSWRRGESCVESGKHLHILWASGMLVNIWAAYAAYMAMSILITLAASIVVCVARGAGKDDTAATKTVTA